MSSLQSVDKGSLSRILTACIFALTFDQGWRFADRLAIGYNAFGIFCELRVFRSY